MPRLSSFLLLALAACTRAPAPSPAPGAPDAAKVAEAADGRLLARKLPRIAYRGGPFLRHPTIVTITFASDDDPNLVARLEQFGGLITRSGWWRAVVDGYCAKDGACIGDGGAGRPVHLAEALPAELRDTDVDALLLRAAQAGRLGPVDENTLWLVYLPRGVGLTEGTRRYCTGRARAFHRSLEIGGARIPFAVLPRCGDEAQLTGTASHEILEATTNAFPAERGFAFQPGPGPSGFSAAGLEPVDPCGLVTMDGHWTMDSGFVVQRAWSNRAAALAQDPCVPARADRPYAMLVPREPAVRVRPGGGGETATVVLDASTAGTVKTWAVSAFDLSGYQDGDSYVALALDKTTVTSGDTVRLTIKARKPHPSRQGIVALVSTIGVDSHMWPLLVVTR